jgi:hypothetical protein
MPSRGDLGGARRAEAPTPGVVTLAACGGAALIYVLFMNKDGGTPILTAGVTAVMRTLLGKCRHTPRSRVE